MMALSEVSVEQLATKIYNAIRCRRSLDAVRDAIVELLGVVLQDLAMYYCRGFAEVLNYLLDFLVRRFKERVQGWIENALTHGLDVAFGRDDRNAVRDSCQSDQQFMDQLTSIGKKAALKQGIKWAGKGVVTGHETAGKVVGASGNIIMGAMAAGAIAGPPGVVIGGIVGGGIDKCYELALVIYNNIADYSTQQTCNSQLS